MMEVERRVRELAPWFHNISLHGVDTAPDHFLGNYPGDKWKRISHLLPQDLKGASVLDIGCNAGFFSVEMKRRGAGRVVAMDNDPRYLAQARFVFDVLGVDAETRELSVYDVGHLQETFDVVLFMGVLYHLRHPLLALDLLHEHVVKHRLLFQSMLRGEKDVFEPKPDYPFEERRVFDEPGFPKMHFVERSYSGDSTNWWIPNAACAQAMLRSAGFRIVDHAEADVFLCERVDRLPPSAS